tara:strand:+ start:131 stop:448 length:318 start_codon:yes stop_codon:yes gene_type:complete
MSDKDIESFKRGQIVPKRLGFAFGGKGQHLIRFGVDCEYDYKRKSLKIVSNGCAVVIHRGFTGSVRRGTKRKCNFTITGLRVHSAGADNNQRQGVHLAVLRGERK